MKLLPLNSINAKVLPLDNYIHVLEDILKKWSTPPVYIENNIVAENIEVYNALWTLGTKYIPVVENKSEVDKRISLDDLDVYYELKEPNIRVYDNVVELVGRDIPTPIVKLKSLGNEKTRVWAKLEWYHPFSLSIKDRIAWYMIINALGKDYLKSKLIYEPTSANTGLGLVGLANYFGLKTRIYLPSTTQKCIDYLFVAMGAEVVRKNTPITVAMIDSVILDAARDNAIVLNQFENDLNFIVHLKYTAKEIDYQLRNKGIRPNTIIGGLGTSGHISALSFYFKNRYGDVKVFGVQPKQGSIIPGIRRIETGMKWIHMVNLDGIRDLTLEEAFQGVLHVARGDGLLVGLSGGAVLYAVKSLIENKEIEGDIIAIIPDHGTKYIELLESLVTKHCPEYEVKLHD